MSDKLDKIFYLPAGRIRSLEPPDMEFEVDDRLTALLNATALAIFNVNRQPWLDLVHDYQTRVFSIACFKLEPNGVYACGQFSELGKKLRDAARISGVSISTFVPTWGDKPVVALVDVEISREDMSRLESLPQPRVKDIAVMGGVLVDGSISALQLTTAQ